MAARSRSGAAAAPDLDHNEVVLVGRLAAAPEQRALPSGDQIVTFRLVVRRVNGRSRPDPAGRVAASRSVVDTVDCTAWRADARRVLAGWQAGDVLEVRGSLRRRFWRSPSGPTSRYDVEVAKVRRVLQGDHDGGRRAGRRAADRGTQDAPPDGP